MAISKHQHNKQELIETFKKFSDIYRSRVEYTGEKLRKIDQFRIPMDPSQTFSYTETDEIAIRLPEDEFERFLRDFGRCIDLYKLARENPMIEVELQRLLILVELYK